ncbi:FCD domain-containing protein [Microbacterium sp. Au-Mic1]|uniref:FadR/GntR family transcriptional regulator n=1 Tax=Microbacterium sp. Au-Mic1 TaxID=2906457 RepID=UPI001E41E4EF|nr:FCD domain-containing protein [Microbacterium sp. Au-Mic1]MCE4026235.1 FCD domain-containing protein [Microbacterium sp. Au-Mic1]
MSAESDVHGQHPFRGLHGQIVETLGSAIGAKTLVAGDRIVPEDVAETSAVSRAVVREALKVLEAKGMVEAAPRVGTRVRTEEDWDLLDPAVIRWRSAGADSAAQFTELLEFRSAIEPLAARLASERVVSERLAALRHAVEAMEVAVRRQDGIAFNEADVDFHRALLVASGNKIVAQQGEPIEAALRVRHALNLVPSTLTDAAVSSHRDIVDAIARGDGGRAELASRRIVDVAGAEIMSSLFGSAGAR